MLQASELSPLKFERYNVEDGLSQSGIISIHQDQKGYMWFGTQSGLNRFDGYEFVHYKNIQGNIIKAIDSDNHGNLWFGTPEGLHVILAEEEQIRSFTSENTSSLTNDNITEVFVSSNGTLWVGSRDGLFSVEMKTTSSKISITATKVNLPSIDVTTIEEIQSHTLWVGSRNELIELNTKNNKYKILRTAETKDSLGFLEILKSSNNEVWIASYWHGLFKYNLEGKQLAHYTTSSTPALAENSVYALAEDDLGRIWLGLTNSGVMLYQDSNFKLLEHDISNPKSLSANAIESLFKDKNGNMWVGSHRRGINKHRPITELFSHLKKSPKPPLSVLPNDIATLLVDDQDNLWIGSAETTLTIFNRNKSALQKITTDNESATSDTYYIIQGSDNYIWASSFDGLAKINPRSHEVEEYYTTENSTLQHGRILNIADNNDGHLWLSHWELGLSKFNKTTGETVFYSEENNNLPSNLIIGLTLDSSGTFWSISAAGLSEYQPETDTFKTYKMYPTGRQHEFESMMLDEDNFMWLTSHNGLYGFDINQRQYVNLTLPDIVANEGIYDVIKDKDGFYWASTNNGLIRFEKNKTDYVQFQTKDGIQSNEFNGSAAAQFSNGDLAFGGNNGLNIFTPSEPVSIPASLRITSIQLNDSQNNKRHINNIPDNLKLLPTTLNLSVSFSSLNFSHPLDTKYSYRIKEIDDQWTLVKGNSITIAQLASGQYTLEIKATNTFGQWQKDTVKLGLEFLPPWYKQKIAYLIYTIIFLTLVYLSFQIKVKNIRQRSAELELLVTQRTKELSDKNLRIESQANELRVAIEEKKQLYESISHELRTPITLILGPVRQLKKQVTDANLTATTTLIERSANRLNRLVNQLLDLSRSDDLNNTTGQTDLALLAKELIATFEPYASDVGIKLVLTSSENALVDLNHDDSEKMLSNLLSNAIKYSAVESSVVIKIKKSEEFVSVQVKDSGIGISTNDIPNIFTRFYRIDNEQTSTIEGSGIGLSIVKSIVEKANGYINVKSVLGQGTSFNIRLPIATKNQLLESFQNNEDNQKIDITDNSELPHLLLIDDNEDMLAYVSSLLTTEYKITLATNGLEGIKLAQELVPDIILSDVMMPTVDGLELLNNIKNNELTSHIPIVLLTAKGSNESKIKALSLHADGYISKPFNEEELSLKLRNLLDTRDILKKKFSAEIVVAPQKQESRENSQFIIKLDAIIEQHYQISSFSVTELAKEAALSERQLLRKLKATADVGAKEYIRSFRLKKAAHLLDNNHSVTSVAEDVGFSSPAYFSSCFKAFYGVTPSQYLGATRDESV